MLRLTSDHFPVCESGTLAASPSRSEHLSDRFRSRTLRGHWVRDDTAFMDNERPLTFRQLLPLPMVHDSYRRKLDI